MNAASSESEWQKRLAAERAALMEAVIDACAKTVWQAVRNYRRKRAFISGDARVKSAVAILRLICKAEGGRHRNAVAIAMALYGDAVRPGDRGKGPSLFP